jgi:fused signal recognition particle receptor
MGVELYVFLAVIAVVAVAMGLATRRAGKKALEAPRREALPARRPRRLPASAEAARADRAGAEGEGKPEPAAPGAAGDKAKPAEAEPARPAAKKRDTSILRAGLAKTRGGFIAKIGELFAGKKEVDGQTLDRLEEVLLTADIGVKTSARIYEAVRRKLSGAALKDAHAVWVQIRAESAAALQVGAEPLDLDRAKPFVILIVGVNGVGKTTTIGKLAAKYASQGKKVLLAAGDTFRAAATEQLGVWAQRTGCEVVRGKEGGDPSSVIFDAVKKAQTEGHDVVICDTAGRLHAKTNLMEELQKVRRVTGKAQDGAPHETFLVLDATTGQNAIAQAQAFKDAVALTGLVLTKLDGTAKGGVVLGICDELKVPVRYIGIGEKVEDLREFDADEFVDALYEDAETPAAA